MPTFRIFGSSKHGKKPSDASDDRVGRSPPGSRSSSPERSGSRSQDRDARGRGRSLSPFAKKRRDESVESLRRVASEDESGHESDGPLICPSNAFEGDSDDDEDEEEEEEDDTLIRNTSANASSSTYDLPAELTMVYPGEGPNLEGPLEGMQQPAFQQPTLRRRATKSKSNPPLPLIQGRPVFERNRCSLTITHGQPDEAAKTRKSRKYIVASDLSDESTYAIQWAIGTVLRDGDECIIVTVMETDTKFDPAEGDVSSTDRKAKMANQKERQVKAALIARQATGLLERTRLHVRVVCSAIHAKSPRHLLVDMIDYIEPTMCIVGTRGLTKIQGMLLGSVSNYLVQKSSAPVMVTRRPLRVTRTVHKKLSALNRENRVRSLAEANIDKESHGGERTEDPVDAEELHEEVEHMTVSDK